MKKHLGPCFTSIQEVKSTVGKKELCNFIKPAPVEHHCIAVQLHVCTDPHFTKAYYYTSMIYWGKQAPKL
jgi:hypothetical protein